MLFKKSKFLALGQKRSSYKRRVSWQLCSFKTRHLFCNYFYKKKPFTITVIGSGDDYDFPFWLNIFESFGASNLPWVTLVDSPHGYSRLWWGLTSSFKRLKSYMSNTWFSNPNFILEVINDYDGPVIVSSQYLQTLLHLPSIASNNNGFFDRLIIIGDITDINITNAYAVVSLNKPVFDVHYWLEVSDGFGRLHAMEAHLDNHAYNLSRNFLPSFIYQLYGYVKTPPTWNRWDFDYRDRLPSKFVKFCGWLSILFTLLWLLLEFVLIFPKLCKLLLITY